MLTWKLYVCVSTAPKILVWRRDGLHVSLGFFSDILIPEHALKDNHSLIIEVLLKPFCMRVVCIIGKLKQAAVTATGRRAGCAAGAILDQGR